jgi:aminoglycoside phosphotransferase
MSPNEIIYALQSGTAKIAKLNELLKADRAELARLRAEAERLNEQLRIESAASAYALHWAEKAEAELITERARLDYLGLHMGMPQVSEALNLPFSQCFPIRDAIDRAMKKETNTP